jgi:putative cardiolipin synthase
MSRTTESEAPVASEKPARFFIECASRLRTTLSQVLFAIVPPVLPPYILLLKGDIGMGLYNSPKRLRTRSLRRHRILLPAFAVALWSCAGPQLQQDVERPAPSYASPPATTGILAEMASRVHASSGPEYSGYHLLDGSHEALIWRLALIDSAVSSVDIMTYLWYPDASGRLILERAVLAARRGVRVRLVVDDLMTIGQEQLHADLERQANIEVRLFNPWSKRSLFARGGEMVAEMERLNTRMHDKLLIADGRAAIIGGRNIGDHYFGLNKSYNFHDLDVLAIGEMAQQSNGMFDQFWNSDWVASARNLTTKPNPERAAASWAKLQKKNREADVLASFPIEPKNWTAELVELEPMLHPGTGDLIYDEVSAEGIAQSMIASMFAIFDRAEEELLITNAYIIPGERGIEFLRMLNDRGVDVRILTNSLASHDVPAVNSHYEPWRDDILRTGTRLFEARADAAIQSLVDVPPVSAKFVGLHSKASVSDGRLVFIGSMNLDPRSGAINTEMGAVIDSPGLGGELRELMLRDMSPDNAWEVSLADDGRLRWTNSDETVYKQPTRGFLQHVMNAIFKVVPKEQF